jgi:hypothetical protein
MALASPLFVTALPTACVGLARTHLGWTLLRVQNHNPTYIHLYSEDSDRIIELLERSGGALTKFEQLPSLERA